MFVSEESTVAHVPIRAVAGRWKDTLRRLPHRVKGRKLRFSRGIRQAVWLPAYEHDIFIEKDPRSVLLEGVDDDEGQQQATTEATNEDTDME